MHVTIKYKKRNEENLDEFAIDGLRGLGYKVDVLDETPKYMYRREQYLCKISWIFQHSFKNKKINK